MNKIRKIHKGDTLGLITVSGFVRENQDYNSFIKVLEEAGYKVKKGKTLDLKYGFSAGTDKERAEDLMSMFLDDEVSGILCFKGGYSAQRILPLLDFEEIKKHPKLVMGFSDVTIILNALRQECDFPTVHGEMGVTLSNYDEFSYQDFFKVLDDDLIGFRNNPTPFEVINEGKCCGELVGGNLSLVTALRGTKYEIDLEDKILFIEDVDEEAYSVDRMLSSLILSGKIQKVKGIICGYFTRCNDSNGFNVRKILIDNLKPLNVPLILNYPSGHDHPFVNLPIGLKIELDTSKGVTVLESLYK